ncbi:MAG: pyridoxal phosphate-dependent aminotransferase [Sarcina sp.]
MVKSFSEKSIKISESMTLELTAKAGDLKSRGVNIINFGVGEPDFNTSNNIIEAAIRAMNSGNTKYTAIAGIKELKKAICRKLKTDNNLVYQEKNIIVSTGAKQSLANVFMAILNEDDEVIIPSPYWVSYPELIKLQGAKPIIVSTEEKNNFKITKEEIQKVANNKTKAIILNTPNNPTGEIYTKEELSDIANICKEFDLYIISDEIYEKLIYDKNDKHVSIASVSEDAFNRSIVINGFSKSYAMTGWRIGYAAATEELVKIMGKIQGHTTSNTNTIAQYAALEALNGSQTSLFEMVEIFKNRRNVMISYLERIKTINYIMPKGAFYCFINIKNILNKDFTDSLDFANKLLDECGLVVIPGIAFGKNEYIRLSYATSEDNIKKGMELLLNFINKNV